jgi:hypothetical protein
MLVTIVGDARMRVAMAGLSVALVTWTSWAEP